MIGATRTKLHLWLYFADACRKNCAPGDSKDYILSKWLSAMSFNPFGHVTFKLFNPRVVDAEIVKKHLLFHTGVWR